MRNLKPCPLCGCKAIMQKHAGSPEFSLIRCGNSDCDVKILWQMDEYELKEKWNKRSLDGDDKKKMEELKDRVEYLTEQLNHYLRKKES